MSERQTSIRKKIAGSELLISLLIAIFLIVIAVGLGWENNKIVPINQSASSHYNLEPNNRLSFLSNWDGPIYLDIAQHGYTQNIEANFFPLYPSLIRIVHKAIPSLLDSGLIVSWVCFVGAVFYYLKIIKSLYKLDDNLEALRGVLFFVLFPTGIFLIATYTESLFAFLALGATYYALQKKYIPAAIFLAFLTATHVNGLFVVLLVALILLEKRLNPIKVIATMLIGCIGIVSYMIYQKAKFGSSFAFIHAQKLHSWINLSGRHIISEALTLNGIFLLLILSSVIYWWPKRKSFSIYSFLYSGVILVGGRDFSGFGRYSLMAFPLEIMLYDYFHNKKLGYPIMLSLTAILWTFVVLRYAGGYTGG